MSCRFVVAMAVLALPLAVGAVSVPAQARSEVFRCEHQEATIVGTPGNDQIQGTARSDVIVGLGGSDSIFGLGGNDVICGGGARDGIDGGAGNDRIHGNTGSDRLVGGAGDDHLFGNLGTFTEFEADQGDDTYASRTDGDIFYYWHAPNGVSVDLATGTATGWGADTFHIGAARVDVWGSAYDDLIHGGPGQDFAGAGNGTDTCVAVEDVRDCEIINP